MGNQVDVEVTFVVLGYLDVRFDVLSYCKVIGCNLIELVEKLTPPSFRHLLLIDGDLERLLVVLPCECFDGARVTLVAILENLLRSRIAWR